MTENISSTHNSQLATHGIQLFSDFAKRVFDILVSSVGLLLLSPVFVWIAWRIKRDSPGPAFYRGARAGRGGKIFHILKFRTMYERPESYQGPRITAQDDPRVTPFGRWLRNTKLNELPQLWNVLKGDMSLVGPRPEDPQIAAALPEEVRREMLSVRPGISSPASVLFRDEEALLRGQQVMGIYLHTILPDKLRLDQLYIRHHTFWLDMDVLLWTLLVLLPKLKAYKPPETSLLLGPASRLARSFLNWFVVDTLVTFLAMVLAGFLWRFFGPLDVGWPTAFGLSLGFALLFSLSGVVVGVNRISWSRAAASDVLDLLPPGVGATVVAVLVNQFWGGRPWFPPGMILAASTLAFTGFVIARYRTRLISGFALRWLALRGGAKDVRERVLIVGCGETGQYTAWLLTNGIYAKSFHVIGFVDDDLYMQGRRINGVNVLGKRMDISRLVSKHDVGIIIFAIHNITTQERQQVLKICTGTPAQLVVMPDLPGALNIMIKNDLKAGAVSDPQSTIQILY